MPVPLPPLDERIGNISLIQHTTPVQGHWNKSDFLSTVKARVRGHYSDKNNHLPSHSDDLVEETTQIDYSQWLGNGYQLENQKIQ